MKKKYRLLVTLSFVLICVVALYTVMKLVEAHLIDANRLRLTAMCTIATIFIVYAIAIYMWKRSRKLQDVRADAALKEGEGMRMRRLERKLLFFLFILTIACIWLPLLTINVIRTNDDAFNYWWVFFSFIPIPTLSIILGKRDSKICLKSKKNVVSGYIVTAYLVFFGTVLFIIRQYVLLNG